jgi:chlorite dismutase
MPAVPLTLEGSAVLHQMFRLRRHEWRTAVEKDRMLNAAATALAGMEQTGSGVFSMLGHKADLMLVHHRRGFQDLNAVELQLASLELFDYLEPTTSYLSVVELGLYESSWRVYNQLAERGLDPFTPAWDNEIEETLGAQRKAMAPRLWPEIPNHRYICFYPMNRRRGESRNWYALPMQERRRQMHEHGLIGRRYAGQVQQIISGSIGFDDWEWGVDLYAEDPLVFKKLIYEMRFDEASAVYADFGPFYFGLRVSASVVGDLFAGHPPPAGPLRP